MKTFLDPDLGPVQIRPVSPERQAEIAEEAAKVAAVEAGRLPGRHRKGRAWFDLVESTRAALWARDLLLEGVVGEGMRQRLGLCAESLPPLAEFNPEAFHRIACAISEEGAR